MTYVKYTGYKKIVELKKLDFIVNSVKEFFSGCEESEIKGLDVGCGKRRCDYSPFISWI